MELIKGNCLEKLKNIPDKSVDLAYMDLCYGQTACKWDKKFTKEEWVIFWKELKRVARNDRTPFFFSCTTKFGFDIIESNKKWFRWDLVWKKNRAAGFLNAYKLPMRKHEMIYCFSDKCPAYDVSSHKEIIVGSSLTDKAGHLYGIKKIKRLKKTHNIPLPTSDITQPTEEHELVYCFAKKCPEYDVSSHSEYKEDKECSHPIEHNGLDKTNKSKAKRHKIRLPTSDITQPTKEHELVYCFAKKCPEYDVSSHTTGNTTEKKPTTGHTYVDDAIGHRPCYDKPHISKEVKIPLPTSDITQPTEEHELVYCFAKKCPEYDVSSHKEYTYSSNKEMIRVIGDNGNKLYGDNVPVKSKLYKNPLPTSDITLPTEEHELIYCFAKKCPEYDVSSHSEYVAEKKTRGKSKMKVDLYHNNNVGVKSKTHKVPLPTSDITPPPIDIDIDEEEPSSWCEFKNDERTGHRTAKPVALMKFLLKYWSKEGGTILDPTMGSGSMGIACKQMNRKFIGIELNDDIYEIAKKRIGDAD